MTIDSRYTFSLLVCWRWVQSLWLLANLIWATECRLCHLFLSCRSHFLTTVINRLIGYCVLLSAWGTSDIKNVWVMLKFAFNFQVWLWECGEFHLWHSWRSHTAIQNQATCLRKGKWIKINKFVQVFFVWFFFGGGGVMAGDVKISFFLRMRPKSHGRWTWMKS